MTGNGLYSLQSARDLFEKAQRDMTRFYDEPSDDSLFNLLCTLNHLREWICPGGPSYKHRGRSKWTRGERLYDVLHHNPDFQRIRDLCNNAKHFNDRGIGKTTTTAHGFLVGLSRAGDSFGQRHYLVDGRDLRESLENVMRAYYGYFNP